MAEDGNTTNSSSTSDPITLDSSTQLLKLSDQAWRYDDTKKSHKVSAPDDVKGDIKIKHGSQEFPASRAALLESSAYFAEQLADSGKEEVDVTGVVSSRQLEMALEYAHRGSLALQTDTAEDCLAAAVKLKIDWLQKACVNYLINSTPPASCGLVLDIAERLALPRLRQDVFDVLGLNLLPLHDDRKLADLPEAVLTELLGGQHYVEAPEELVLHVVVDWVNSHFEERRELLAKLVKLVRFNLMTADELENLPPALLDIEGVKQRADAALALWRDPYGAPTAVDQLQLEPRGAADLVVALSTHAADTIQYSRLGSDDDGRLFREQFGCSVAGVLLDHAGVARLGNFLFVVGGYDMGYDVSDRVHRYDPRFRNWLPVASLQQRRVNFAILSSASSLFVVGGSTRGGSSGGGGREGGTSSKSSRPSAEGEDGEEEEGKDGAAASESEEEEEEEEADHEPGEGETPLKSCERYDPATNTWSEIASLPYGCFGLAGCHLDGAIFVSGGITDNPSDSVPVSHVYKLLIGNTEWTQQASMLCRRQGHGLHALGGKVYAIGGLTTISDDETQISVAMHSCLKNECYDPQTNQWTEIAPTPQAFGHLYKDAVTRADCIYVLGGKRSSRYLHEYSTSQNQWTSGRFFGDNLIKLVSVRAAVPLQPSSDCALPAEEAEEAAANEAQDEAKAEKETAADEQPQ